MEETKMTEEQFRAKLIKQMGYNPFMKADVRQKLEKQRKDKQKRRAKNKLARKARRK